MFKSLLRFITDLIFPPRCAICGGVTPINTEICDDCYIALNKQFTDETLCTRCGKPVNSCICRDDMSFSRCVSVFEYCGKTSMLFKKLKNDADSTAASQLSEMMEELFYRCGYDRITFSCITSVPADEESYKVKGFDHARRLAELLSANLSIPYVQPPIKRSENYRTHHTLNRLERIENANSGYISSSGSVSGNVLLVDDIVTSGATLEDVILFKKSATVF